MVRARRFLYAVATAAVIAGCGGSSPSPRSTASSSAPSAAPRPSAAVGPCASVTTTTPIAQVPPACAALWAPYGVTKVPPANLTDATPVPPEVVNATNGAVSDADARAWALAANRGSVWYRWAEANIQPSLLGRLGLVSLDPPVEREALAQGVSIQQPDCAIFPIRFSLFPVGASELQFLTSLGEVPTGKFALVGSFPGSCVVTGVTTGGQTKTIATYSSAGTTFFIGTLTQDPALGVLWFVSGGANCLDRGAPTRWCT